MPRANSTQQEVAPGLQEPAPRRPENEHHWSRLGLAFVQIGLEVHDGPHKGCFSRYQQHILAPGCARLREVDTGANLG